MEINEATDKNRIKTIPNDYFACFPHSIDRPRFLLCTILKRDWYIRNVASVWHKKPGPKIVYAYYCSTLICDRASCSFCVHDIVIWIVHIVTFTNHALLQSSNRQRIKPFRTDENEEEKRMKEKKTVLSFRCRCVMCRYVRESFEICLASFADIRAAKVCSCCLQPYHMVWMAWTRVVLPVSR